MSYAAFVIKRSIKTAPIRLGLIVRTRRLGVKEPRASILKA